MSEARKDSEGFYLDKGAMEDLQEDAYQYGYVNGENIKELVTGNYEKFLEKFSADEMERFFQKRADIIYENLVSDVYKDYTDEEIVRSSRYGKQRLVGGRADCAACII